VTPASVAQMIQSRGEICILRRPGSPDVDVTVKAVVRGGAADDLAGANDQARGTARISNAEIKAASWPGPPQAKTDQLIRFPASAAPRALQIVEVDARMLGDEAAMYVLTWVG
jgi:hypothetical protein